MSTGRSARGKRHVRVPWRAVIIGAVVIAVVGSCGGGEPPSDGAVPRELAFISRGDSGRTVWMIDELGHHLREVTPGFGDVIDLAFSPDGALLYFCSNVSGDAEIYALDLVSGSTIRLTFDPARDRAPSVSPDGSTIVFLSDRTGRWPQVWTMDPDGGNLRQLTDVDGYKIGPTYRPDGQALALQADLPTKQIYLLSADGATWTNLSSNEHGDRYPTWSPDGTQLAFTSVRDGTRGGSADGVRGIYVMNADGSAQRPLLGDGIDARHPDWSPDGGLIAFDREAADGSRQVFVAAPDGTGLRQVTATAQGTKPRFRPQPGDSP